MTQEQINRTEMYEATNGYMDRNAAVWSTIPIVNTYKTKLVGIISGIKTSAGDQEAAQVFIGNSTREMKQQLSIKLDILDDTLEAYAADTENAELLSKASNSKSDYFRLSNEDFEIKGRNTLDLLTENVGSMTEYGTSAEQIDETKVNFNNFLERRGKPRAYQIESRIATQNLEELFKEGNKILDRMDKVLKRFKRTNPAFYNGYSAARTIIDK